MSRELCIMACVFCRDPLFMQWLDQTNPVSQETNIKATVTLGDEIFDCQAYSQHSESSAKAHILGTCGIESRNQLDTNAEAARRFHEKIRQPFLAWRDEQQNASLP